MAAVIIGTPQTGTQGTAGTSQSVGTPTVPTGDGKSFYIVVASYDNTGGANGPHDLTVGGSTSGVEFLGGLDVNRSLPECDLVLSLYRYRLGSGTSMGAVAFTTTANARHNWVYWFVEGEDATQPFTIVTDPDDINAGALAGTAAYAGIAVLGSFVFYDDGVQPGAITIDGAQTLIGSAVRGSGTSTEARLSVSYKTVSAGAFSLSAASVNPCTGGSIAFVIREVQSGGDPKEDTPTNLAIGSIVPGPANVAATLDFDFTGSPTGFDWGHTSGVGVPPGSPTSEAIGDLPLAVTLKGSRNDAVIGVRVTGSLDPSEWAYVTYDTPDLEVAAGVSTSAVYTKSQMAQAYVSALLSSVT